MQEYPNLLSNEEVEIALQIIEKEAKNKMIQIVRSGAEPFRTLLLNRLPEYEIGDVITLSKRQTPIKPHYDKQVEGDFTHKLLIYLSTPSKGGATVFYLLNNLKHLVRAEKGKGVVFPLSLKHGGEDFPSTEWKYTMGLRLKIK